jgi:ADP-heptose:LPS heptosyltransferase
MRLSAMGDVAMTVPVLRAFVDQHPQVKITVISRPFSNHFLTNSQSYFFCLMKRTAQRFSWIVLFVPGFERIRN